MKIRRLVKEEIPPMELLLSADPSPEMVQNYLKRGLCNIAELAEQIIGVYVLLPSHPSTVELVNLAVAQKYQGQGFGKQLVQHAVQTAKIGGYKILEVGTGNSSIAQLAFYQKCGFRITGVDKDFFTRNYSEIIMENGLQCRDMIRMEQHL